MIANPFEPQSDSFYFVENKLIMHNKASYRVSQLYIIRKSLHILIRTLLANIFLFFIG